VATIFKVESTPPEAHAPEVAEALERSVRISDKLFENHPGLCDANSRADHATRLFGLALDHREAIILLVNVGARSSAYALVRSVYEACFRGLWVRYVATDQQLTTMQQGISPKFESIVKQLSRIPGAAASEVFGKSKALAWDAFCDYSHGGARQLQRWQSGNDIGPSHPDHEIPGLLLLLDHLALAASIGVHDANGTGSTPGDALFAELRNALSLMERSQAPTHAK